MPDAAAPFGWSSSQDLIAYVDLAISERATPEMLGLGQSRSADPRGCGSSMVMIAVMCTSQKNMAPESFPRPDPIGARRISGRAAIVDYIVTAVAGVKLPLFCRLRNHTPVVNLVSNRALLITRCEASITALSMRCR